MVWKDIKDLATVNRNNYFDAKDIERTWADQVRRDQEFILSALMLKVYIK